MEDQIKGQMTIDMFLDAPEDTARSEKVDFSCFKSKRGNHPNSITLGKCPFSEKEKWDRRLSCEDCEAYNLFYEAAHWFREKGFKWNQSVELSKKYYKIESAYTAALQGIDEKEIEEVLNEYRAIA